MAEVGLRDLGAFVPGGRRDREPPPIPPASEPPAPTVFPRAPEPSVPAPGSSDVLVTPPPPKRPGFGGDLAEGGTDALGIDPTLAQLAELVAHRATALPLCVGLLGGPGSGKSFALGRLARRIRDLAAAAAGGSGPFVDKIHVQPIDAAALESDVATGLAAALHAGLREAYPALAREIAQTARDPHVVLREANDKLDEARRRLDSERRTLDDAGSRRARLTETVLYEAAGSQVDAYARANRAGIESRLAAFGIQGDPIRNYKDFVQYVAGSGGRVGLALRALWGFKGQMKLIVGAALFVAVGIGLGIALEDQARLLGDLRSGPQAGNAVADWLAAHVGLIATLKTAAYAIALVLAAANLVRAAGFLKPIFKGARLLDHDLETRRRDLDGLYAHQTKRVDTLEADVERLGRDAAEAERRTGGLGQATIPSPFEPAAQAQAQNFFAVLARLLRDPGGLEAPKRIIITLDHLDAVAPERGRSILDTLHRLGNHGLAALVAADPARLDPDGTRRGDLERWIQVPVRVDAGASEHDHGALVATMLGFSAPAPAGPPVESRHSLLDTPVSEAEATLLASLSSLAGPSPRAVKRFVNLYTLGRLDETVRRGPLALILATRQGGSDTEQAALHEALASREDASGFDMPQGSVRQRAALDATRALDGRFTLDEAKAAARRAATFSI